MSLQHEKLIELLREVNKGMKILVSNVLAEHDIPVAMVIAAKQIREEPGITISELARKTGIAKSHISNISRDLDKRGWAEKRADATDQRIIRLYLTPPAVLHLEQIRKDIRAKMNELVLGISEEQAQNLISGLEEMKLALGQTGENVQEIDTDD